MENIGLFEVLGIKEGELGSHSCWKGEIKLVSADCTVSPPISTICLSAGCSMGPVKDRFIHYKKSRRPSTKSGSIEVGSEKHT